MNLYDIFLSISQFSSTLNYSENQSKNTNIFYKYELSVSKKGQIKDEITELFKLQSLT